MEFITPQRYQTTEIITSKRYYYYVDECGPLNFKSRMRHLSKHLWKSRILACRRRSIIKRKKWTSSKRKRKLDGRKRRRRRK